MDSIDSGSGTVDTQDLEAKAQQRKESAEAVKLQKALNIDPSFTPPPKRLSVHSLTPSDSRPPGRPSKYDPSMCETMLNLFREGASISKICSELNIARSTFFSWLDPRLGSYQQEFAEAFWLGKEHSQAHWESIAENYMIEYQKGPKLNTTAWSFIMKNRFEDYRGDGGITINNTMVNSSTSYSELAQLSDDELDAKLKEGL